MNNAYVAKIEYEASYYMQEVCETYTDVRIVHAESEKKAIEKIKSHQDYQSIEFETYVRIIEIDIKSPIV